MHVILHYNPRSTLLARAQRQKVPTMKLKPGIPLHLIQLLSDAVLHSCFLEMHSRQMSITGNCLMPEAQDTSTHFAHTEQVVEQPLLSLQPLPHLRGI